MLSHEAPTIMLVDPALWMAFCQANALQEALHTCTQLEPHALVMSQSPRRHDPTPCSVDALLLAVSEAEQQLEASLSGLSLQPGAVAQSY
jgi:hypothetical protein